MLAIAFVLQVFDYGLERLVIFAWPFLDAHHHVTVHLEKSPIRIPREPRVLRFLRDDLSDLIVHPEVEDCVHHSGHGIARA